MQYASRKSLQLMGILSIAQTHTALVFSIPRDFDDLDMLQAQYEVALWLESQSLWHRYHVHLELNSGQCKAYI